MEKIRISETSQNIFNALHDFGVLDSRILDHLHESYTFVTDENKEICTAPELVAQFEAASTAYRKALVEIISARIWEASTVGELTEI